MSLYCNEICSLLIVTDNSFEEIKNQNLEELSDQISEEEKNKLIDEIFPLQFYGHIGKLPKIFRTIFHCKYFIKICIKP